MEVFSGITVFLSWAIGGFCNGAIGMGGTFLALPLSLLALSPNEGILMVVLVNLYSAVLLVFAFRSYADKKEIGYIILGSIPGCFLGTYILKIAPVAVLQILIGIVLLLFVFMQKFKKISHWVLPNSREVDIFVGVISGVSATTVGMAGAPLGIYIILKHWHFLKAKGNLACIFFVICLAAVFVQAISGLYSVEIAEIALIGILGCTIGQVLGVKAGKYINQQLFVRILILFLTISAIILFERAIR